MREIVFDTETTGLSFSGGDRMVEIGCVELINRVETGRTFHAYYHPERTMPPEAFAVHGLSAEFLADKPLFAHIVEEFLEFVGDAVLVIHNAGFDMKFINAELSRIGRPTLAMARTSDPHSATAQFFINVADNDFLNFKAPTSQGWGYAVFGKVVKGQDVVDAIKAAPTGRRGMHDDVPKDDVVIEKAVAL